MKGLLLPAFVSAVHDSDTRAERLDAACHIRETCGFSIRIVEACHVSKFFDSVAVRVTGCEADYGLLISFTEIASLNDRCNVYYIPRGERSVTAVKGPFSNPVVGISREINHQGILTVMIVITGRYIHETAGLPESDIACFSHPARLSEVVGICFAGCCILYYEFNILAASKSDDSNMISSSGTCGIERNAFRICHLVEYIRRNGGRTLRRVLVDTVCENLFVTLVE